VRAGDRVLDLGAGAGALTRELARRGAHVVAVELDPALCRRLRRLRVDQERREHRGRRDQRAQVDRVPAGRVDVVQGDALRHPLPPAPFKVVANPPFRRSSALVRRLAQAEPAPDDVWLVLQREVALGFAGAPWRSETLSSLGLKPWWHVEVAAPLRRSDFDPPPAVETALLWLARRPRPLVERAQAELYRDFVADAFGRRGSRLRDGLAPLFSGRQLGRLRRDLRWSAGARPSDLGFDAWLALFRVFARESDAVRRARVRGAARRLPR